MPTLEGTRAERLWPRRDDEPADPVLGCPLPYPKFRAMQASSWVPSKELRDMLATADISEPDICLRLNGKGKARTKRPTHRRLLPAPPDLPPLTLSPPRPPLPSPHRRVARVPRKAGRPLLYLG